MRSFAFSDPGLLVPKKPPSRLRQAIGLTLIPLADFLLLLKQDLRRLFGHH